jgi:hypothetical protein
MIDGLVQNATSDLPFVYNKTGLWELMALMQMTYTVSWFNLIIPKAMGTIFL